MHSPGINGEVELRGQTANPGSPGKMAVKTECVFSINQKRKIKTFPFSVFPFSFTGKGQGKFPFPFKGKPLVFNFCFSQYSRRLKMQNGK